jgi:hypothetical protein
MRRFNTKVIRTVPSTDRDAGYFQELEVHEDASVRIIGDNHGFFRVPMVELRQRVDTIEELGTEYPDDYFIVKTKKDQKHYQVPEGTMLDVDGDRAYRRLDGFLLKVDAYDIDYGITYVVFVPDEEYGTEGHLERWDVRFVDGEA